MQEYWDKKGRESVGVRWVDVDNGFGVHRNRLVAKDLRPRSRAIDKEGLFAATPPLELVKMVIMWAARSHNSGRRRKVIFVDIGMAYLCAPLQEEEYLDLPSEKAQTGTCARLLYTFFWDEDGCNQLGAGGDVRIVVHGDDFVVDGEEED